ncbi:LysR family transcriptional regulator [Paraburkholderia sp. J69-1]|uniref:LysR family transcriptional regulator n=1 Tax=unclassified Paraburkholderia TaxID=2615204 RepID=UPI0039F056EB
MNLRQLQYFRTVVEQGSLASAAEILHIAQPPLSVAIKQLEGEWGVSLFERAGRGLVITDTGRALYDRVCELLNHAEQIDEEMMALGRGTKGRVRVGFVAAGLEAVAQTVAELHAELPLVTFSLHQGEPRLLEDMVEHRALDFAVTQMPVSNPALAVKELSALEFFALVRSGSEHFPADEDLTFDKLSGLPLIVLRRSSGHGIYERVLEELRKASAAANVVADCSDVHALSALVRQGVGIGVLPFSKPTAIADEIKALPIKTNAPAERLALIHALGRRFLPVVQRAISACTAHAARMHDAHREH